MAELEDPDVISVADFARQYRVDESIVRAWIRRGHIDYVLVGRGKMQSIRKSAAIKPIGGNGLKPLPNIDDLRVKHDRDQLVRHLMVANEMPEAEAIAAVGGFTNDQVSEMLVEFLKGE